MLGFKKKNDYKERQAEQKKRFDFSQNRKKGKNARMPTIFKSKWLQRGAISFIVWCFGSGLVMTFIWAVNLTRYICGLLF